MTDINLRILLNAAKGNTTSVIGDVTKALGSGGLQGALLGIGVVGVGALVSVGVAAVKMAAQYQSAMTQLQNTTGSSDAQMKDYTATIRSLSDTTGKSQIDLAKGMYQIISANFAGADAERILTTATKNAIIAGADQTQVTTGLVVTLNAFKLKASEADTVANQMFKTLSLGRGQMNDLAGALQTGGALVAHYGVSVTDMDATLATLSTGGMKTFGTSMTGLTQLLNVMDGKTDLIAKRINALGGSYTYTTEKTKQIYDAHHRLDGKLITVMGHMETIYTRHTGKLGLGFDEAKFKAMDFTHQIAYLTEIFKGHEKQMVAVLGSKQAAIALGILGTQSQLLTSNLKKLGDAQELARQKQEAWTKVQGDFNFQWEKFKTNMQNLLIDLGMKLLPYLTPVVKQFSDWAINLQYTFVPWLRNAVDNISQFVGWMQQGSGPAQALKITLGAIATLMVAKTIGDTATAVLGLSKNAMEFITGSGAKLLAYFSPSGLAAQVGTSSSLIEGDLATVGLSADATAGDVAMIGSAAEVDAVEATAATGTIGGAFSGLLGIIADVGGAIMGLLGPLAALGLVFSTVPDTLKSMQDQGFFKNAGWQNQTPGDTRLRYGTQGQHGILSPDQYPTPGPTPPVPYKSPYGTYYPDPHQYPSSPMKHFASGGPVMQTGPALVHQGEYVVPAGGALATRSGGGPVFNITISTMAGSRAEIIRMVDLIEAEMASRFRSTTPNYGIGGIV